LRSIDERDVLPLVGAGIAALALAFGVYYVLLPWTGVLGFVVVTFSLFVGAYGLLIALDSPQPIVVDRLAAVIIHGVAIVVFIALVVVVFFTFSRGLEALRNLNFFYQDLGTSGPLVPLAQGGMIHAILGTLIMITIALIVTVPIGITAAVFLAETRGPLTRFTRTVVEAMTALPSIIAGLFIYALIITLQAAIGVGEKSGLAAALALAVMMLPIVIRAADVVLRLVPGTLKEAALALGAPQWRVVWHVTLPTSRSGLMTAVILGTARGIGETSPVLLTAGYTTFTNLNFLSGNMVSLPLATFILTRSSEPNQIARGFGAAALLMLLVLLLFAAARTIGGRPAGVLSPGQARRRARQSARDVQRFHQAAAGSVVTSAPDTETLGTTRSESKGPDSP
jgi:phosphate transport system permease protein